MISRRVLKWWAKAACLAALAFSGVEQVDAQDAQPPAPGPMDGVEVLARGPVHEAFAGVISFHPEPGAIASKAPPKDIEELPPDQKPEGDNVVWIPGYWAWDDERSDYLWISGIWRAVPPGRQWVPGYWAAADQNFQWTSGYWADAGQTNVQYLPEPPATIEQGPNIAAPGSDQNWIPGTWIWNQNRYAWQPGYWAPAQQNWMWVPPSYVWAPGGYIFVNGYWDYSVARRGMLFAPVYFNANVLGRQGFSYSPFAVINAAAFANQLFLRPNYQHYYFGDYYASNYASAGFYPWFSFNSGRYGYDPFYAQQRWQNRQNPNWAKTVQADYKNRVDHKDARPAHTFAEQQTQSKTGAGGKNNSIAAVTSLDQMGKNQDNPVKLQKVDQAEKQKFVKQGQDVRQYQASRQKLEAKSSGSADAKTASETERRTLKMEQSPIMAKANTGAGSDQAPPKPHSAPKPDTKVEPKARDKTDRPATAKGTPKSLDQDAKSLQPKGQTKNDAKPESKPMPPKPMPKDEPETTPTPKAKPKVEPKPPASKPEPMPSPKVEPKVEPMPSPKVEPKPMPKVEPRPEPKQSPEPRKPAEPTKAPQPKKSNDPK
jgi:hypothetical protein